MQITCRFCDSVHNFSATRCAVLPLIPASISSKMSVPISSWLAVTVRIASIIRDSSPPEATFDNGFKASPGLAAITKYILSVPFAEKCPICSKTASNRTSAKFKSCNAARICAHSFCAAAFLKSESCADKPESRFSFSASSRFNFAISSSWLCSCSSRSFLLSA